MANLFMLLVFAFFSVFSEAEGASFYDAYIQNTESGKCVTIEEDKPLSPLVASDCICSPLQRWKTDGDFVMNIFALYPYMDQLYGNTKRSNGDTIGIYSKTSSAWQKWTIREEGDGRSTFAAQRNNKCLHQSSGGKLVQWDCNGDQAQKWTIVENPCPGLANEPNRYQLQNTATGLCAGLIDNRKNAFAKIGALRCSCDNKFHYWNRRLDRFNLISDGSKQCMANWEPGHPGITQCGCDAGPVHRFGYAPFEDGSFNIVNGKTGQCIHVNGQSENSPLGFTRCDRNDEQQKWRFYDQCRPEPPPTPKPTQPPVTKPPVTLPPPTQAPPTLPPQPVNVIPQYLTYFFGNGQMNWLTPERYTLLYGGRWDPATATYYTVDGRQIKPNTPDWTKYFGDATPSFLNVLFQGKTFNETFGWMRPDFFDIWTSWKTIPTPAPTPAPQPPNVVPHYQVTYFNNGQMNWLNPERYNLLVGGRWDPVTLTYYTVDGRQIKPNTPDWTTYFGDANPYFLNALFPNGKTWNETFGWMNPNYFQVWTTWQNVPTPAPTPPPQPPNVIPTYQVTYFNNGQMNWLNPTRYSQLVGGRWDPSTFTWYTADGKQIKPNTPEWTSYFGTLQPSNLNQFFPNGASFNQAFGWITPTFFQQWTGWNQVQVNRIQIFVPGNIPVGTRQLFSSGQVNWLTPERINMLAGGQWTGYDYITRTQMRVTPGSPNWSTYFGSADPSVVNALLSGPGYWDHSLSWVTEAVKNVPKGQYTGSFQWNNIVH